MRSQIALRDLAPAASLAPVVPLIASRHTLFAHLGPDAVGFSY